MGRYAAVTAAAVYWVFPSYLLWKSIHFHIFYASGMLFDALALLLVLRLRERPSRRDVVLLGFVAGIGLWQSFQLVTIIPVAIALARAGGAETSCGCCRMPFPGLLAGFVPVLVSNLRHGWWSLDLGEIGIQSTYASRIGTFYTDTLPDVTRSRAPRVRGTGSSSRSWCGSLRAARRRLSPVRVEVLAHEPRAARRWLSQPSRSSTRSTSSPGLPSTPAMCSCSTPVLALVLCASITRPGQGLWAMGAVVLLVGGSFIDLQANEVNGQAVLDCAAKGSYLPRDFGPLVGELDRLGIRRLYADYWTAYRIDYEASEHIIAADGRVECAESQSGGRRHPEAGRSFAAS